MQAGENVCALARELGVLRKSFYGWRDLWRQGGADTLRPRSRPGRLPALLAVVDPSVANSDALAQAQRRLAAQSPQGRWSTHAMCTLAGLNRASYYRQWQRSAPAEADTALRDRLQELALAHVRYGYRRLGTLLRKEDWPVNHKRVLRLTRQDNLLCLRRKAFVPATTDSRHAWRAYPNLARRWVVSGVNQLWVADITYIRLQEQFVYLAVVLDTYSRRVIGWALADHLQASLPLAALRQALACREVMPGLVHHSDRGVQYACGDSVALLAEHGIVVSMSRPAHPDDNAKAESFMATPQREQADGRQWHTIEERRSS